MPIPNAISAVTPDARRTISGLNVPRGGSIPKPDRGGKFGGPSVRYHRGAVLGCDSSLAAIDAVGRTFIFDYEG